MARSAKPRKRKSPVRHSDQPRYVVVTNGAKVIHIRRLKSDPGVNLLS